MVNVLNTDMVLQSVILALSTFKIIGSCFSGQLRVSSLAQRHNARLEWCRTQTANLLPLNILHYVLKYWPFLLTWVVYLPSECSFFCNRCLVINVNALRYFFSTQVFCTSFENPDQANNAWAALWVVVGRSVQRAAFTRQSISSCCECCFLLREQEATTFRLWATPSSAALCPKSCSVSLIRAAGRIYTHAGLI